MELIGKDRIVAEIKRKINEINLDSIEDWRYRLQREHDIEVMKNILSIIDTIEVKEVDLEKEIDDYMAKEWEGVEEDKPLYDMMKNELSDIAKHFYELGLKVAQKEE